MKSLEIHLRPVIEVVRKFSHHQESLLLPGAFELCGTASRSDRRRFKECYQGREKDAVLTCGYCRSNHHVTSASVCGAPPLLFGDDALLRRRLHVLVVPCDDEAAPPVAPPAPGRRQQRGGGGR